MALEAFIGRGDVYRVLLEEAPEGVYIFVYTRPGQTVPDVDYFQDNWEQAKEFCDYYLKIGSPDWRHVPDDAP